MRMCRAVLVLTALLLAACKTTSVDYPASTAPGAAVANAAAAAVTWVAVGCRFQGCPYGSYCNKNTGYCETTKCSEGCPEGTICNEGLNRCQAPPPPQTPNDFLPQDNQLTNLPTMH